MIGEIIAIGDELTSGRVTNTTSAFAVRKLFLLGHEIRAMHTIGDDPDLIGATLKAALVHADFIILTGGLGATTDDMTNEAITRALALKTFDHPGVKASLMARWPPERFADTISLNKLTRLPQGAEVLDDACHMAGYLLRYTGKPIYLLPGVPPQMETLLLNKVLPGLNAFSPTPPVPVCQQLYRTCGLKEIEINRRLLPLEDQDAIHIGYYPVESEVHVSLLIRGLEKGQADPLFIQTDAFIRKALGSHLFGTNDQTLAYATGQALQTRHLMLGLAESCTGGLLASRITEVPGSSQWFVGGTVVYSNAAKQQLLGIDPALIDRHGAVSGETARAMASCTAECLPCDIAVSATGIAGPDGGSIEKPVGTVYIGLSYQNEVHDHLFHFSGSRRQVQEKTAHTALDLVRRALLER